MGTFLAYSIGSGIILLALFLMFRLTLSSENQHGYNRCVILSIYAIAFLSLPLMDIVKGLLRKPVSGASDAMTLPDITMIVSTVGISQQQTLLWGTVLIWIFILGMAVMLVRTVISWIQIVRIVQKGEKIQKDGYTLVLTDDEKLSPFSWIIYVVMSRKDYKLCGQTILSHELRHIGLYHWIDLLVAQAVIIINWFNPAAWLMREELMLIHEYQADMAVLSSGHDTKEYQMLLIKKAIGARLPSSLANSLNHTKLKKRICMMYQSKSSKVSRLKALALVPAVVVALAVSSIPFVQAAMTTISLSSTTVSKVTDNSVNSQSPTQVTTTSPSTGNDASVMTAEEITVVSAGTMEKPNTWDDVKVIGVGAKKKSDALANTNIGIPSELGKCTYIVDGKEMTQEEVNRINPETIESISVFKGENDSNKSVVIELKKNNSNATAQLKEDKPNNLIMLKKDAPAVAEPEVIVDGKKTTMEELSSTYTPNDIESIVVNREENKIYVSLKNK